MVFGLSRKPAEAVPLKTEDDSQAKSKDPDENKT